MWESRLLLARFPRGSWKEWEDCLCLSTLSTAPSFPQLSPPLFFARRRPDASIGRLAVCQLVLLGLLHPIARNVQLDDHAMMHQPVDRRRRHHGIFEDPFPF